MIATVKVVGTGPQALKQVLVDVLGASAEGNPVAIGAGGGSVVLKSRCDLNGDSKIDLADVLGAVGQAVGMAACTTADLTGRGRCDVVDVQRVVNAAVSGTCRYGM